VLRYSKRPKKNKAPAVAPTTHRHMISANVSDGRRYAARKPSSVGEMRGINSGYPNPTNASPALTSCRGGRLVRPAREASLRSRNSPQGLPHVPSPILVLCRLIRTATSNNGPKWPRFLLIAQMYCQRHVASYVSTRVSIWRQD
jgi:hypothetical protein